MSRELHDAWIECLFQIKRHCEQLGGSQTDIVRRIELIADCISDPDVAAAIDAYLTQQHIEKEA